MSRRAFDLKRLVFNVQLYLLDEVIQQKVNTIFVKVRQLSVAFQKCMTPRVRRT